MKQDGQGKPVPEMTDFTRPFWTAARNRKLVMQKCSRCDTINFFPKPWCIECGDRDLQWVEVKTTGEIYSHTSANVVMMNFPGWKKDLPVIQCIIDLDDGGRMYGQLTDCKPEDVKVGMRVQAYFEDISDEAAVPKFRAI